MKLSLIRFGGGGDADVPAHIREKMSSNWYVRHFNSFTTRGRANSVVAVVGGWILFGYAMSKLAQSRKTKQLISEPSSTQKSGHH
ncbi:hypothetical protein I4U23_003413 [Adineta vaga]|nr:hypothetical protein I4U23_003413 [Adineta vaga]